MYEIMKQRKVKKEKMKTVLRHAHSQGMRENKD